MTNYSDRAVLADKAFAEAGQQERPKDQPEEVTGGIERFREYDKAFQMHLRQACEHKVVLHADAAISIVDTDPSEAEGLAYEAGREAWDFDIQVPAKLGSHPLLSAAFRRGFEEVESHAQRQGRPGVDPLDQSQHDRPRGG